MQAVVDCRMGQADGWGRAGGQRRGERGLIGMEMGLWPGSQRAWPAAACQLQIGSQCKACTNCLFAAAAPAAAAATAAAATAAAHW